MVDFENFLYMNKGSLFFDTMMSSIAFRAETGHRSDAFKLGMLIVAMCLLFYIVLDHFTIMTASLSENTISALQRCLLLSKATIEYGKTLDNLRNEKKTQ